MVTGSTICECRDFLNYCIRPTSPWLFIVTCWSKQYGFNLVRHPQLESREKISAPARIQTRDPDHDLDIKKTDALNCSTMIRYKILNIKFAPKENNERINIENFSCCWCCVYFSVKINFTFLKYSSIRISWLFYHNCFVS